MPGQKVAADITIYNMDIRTFGKQYEEFYQMARDMGINFVKGKVAKIQEIENGDLKFHVEVFGEDGGIKTFEHDLAVLSLGVVPQFDDDMATIIPVARSTDGFIQEIRMSMEPGITSIPGVFATGMATSPRDIVDSIVSGSAIANKTSIWLEGGLRETFFAKNFLMVKGG